MALEYRIDPRRQLVTITGEYASATEWLLLAGRLRRDPLFKPHAKFLRDLRGSTHPPNNSMAAAIFNVIQRFWPELQVDRWAVVTDHGNDAVPITMQALGEHAGLAIRVFTSPEQALEWLEADAGGSMLT
jgi:hypothetical protein